MTTEQFQPNKRPSKAITFEEKLAILRELEAGASRRDVEENFKCSQSTISRVLLNRETILQFADSDISVNGLRDAMVLNKDIEEPLTQWAHGMKTRGIAITANMVKQKAEVLSKEAGKEFRYSAQWLHKWKARENVKLAKRPGEMDGSKEILKGLLDKGEEREKYSEEVKRIKLKNDSGKDTNIQEDRNQEAEVLKTGSLNGSLDTPEKPRTKREYIRRLPAFMKVEGGSEYPGHIYRSRKEKTFLTLLQKLEILQRLKNGERRPDLIIEYKLSQSAMSQIVSDENKILKLAEGGQNLQMKRVRGGIFKDGEAELNSWVKQKMKLGESLTRNQIKNKAKEIADRLHIDFKASTGWLEKWKARMNLDFNENQILQRKIPSYIANEDDSFNEMELSQHNETGNEQDNFMLKHDFVDNDKYCYDDSVDDDVKPEFLTPQQFYLQTLQGDQQTQVHEEEYEPEDIKPFIGTPPHILPVPEFQEETLHEQVLNWLNKYNVSPVAATDLLNILQPHLNSVVKPTKTSTPLHKNHRYT